MARDSARHRAMSSRNTADLASGAPQDSRQDRLAPLTGAGASGIDARGLSTELPLRILDAVDRGGRSGRDGSDARGAADQSSDVVSRLGTGWVTTYSLLR